MARTLRHTGKGYTGVDHITGVVIKVGYGEVVTVSDEKAAQLYADWRLEWSDVVPAVVLPEPPAEQARPARSKPGRPRREKA